MTEPLLSVRDLNVGFATRQGLLRAVDGISFDVGRGEVVGLVGESGAGKSVTGLAAIGLLDAPGRILDGEIRFDGMRIDDLPERRMRQLRGRRIGMIFQDPLANLNPFYRVGEQMIETLKAHENIGTSAARKRAIDMMAEVGIPAPQQRIDAFPHELSGGMRQRIGIALTLCARPDLLIADEPTSALDVSVQEQVLDLLRRLVREHATALLLITHDMAVIGEMADRIVVMYAGRGAESGEVRDILRTPLHPYSRGLLGAIPPLRHDVARLTQIPGSMPGLGAVPSGCAFHPRCAYAFDRCRSERPESLPRDGRAIACHLYDGAPVESAA